MTVLDQVSLFVFSFVFLLKKRVQRVLLNIILQRDGAYRWCSGSQNHLIAIRFRSLFFRLQSKNRNIRLAGDSKLTLNVCEIQL